MDIRVLYCWINDCILDFKGSVTRNSRCFYSVLCYDYSVLRSLVSKKLEMRAGGPAGQCPLFKCPKLPKLNIYFVRKKHGTGTRTHKLDTAHEAAFFFFFFQNIMPTVELTLDWVFSGQWLFSTSQFLVARTSFSIQICYLTQKKKQK